MMARISHNMEFFIGYEVPPFARYTPNLSALRASELRVVSAAGIDSQGEPPAQCAAAVATLLGANPVIFPGDHGGFGNRSEEFARKLADVLSH